MTSDIESAARAMYDACPSVKPTWDQLGDATRSVWRERVTRESKSHPPRCQKCGCMMYSGIFPAKLCRECEKKFPQIQDQENTGLKDEPTGTTYSLF